jgi:lysozyme
LHNEGWGMVSRRVVFGAALASLALAGCGGQAPVARRGGDVYIHHPPAGPTGLDAVIDISHGVTVSDFGAIRQSGILGLIHKATEGGDWVDPSYAVRRPLAEQAGLLWGAYHFGTRQYPGSDQAMSFLSVVRPGASTLIALDLEPNDGNPRNTMTLAQAEAFVTTVRQQTGRLPMLYTHPQWANGQIYGRRRLSLGQPVQPGSLLAQCDLWLADYREQPEIPWAWADRGWKLWQYAANQTETDVAYGSQARAVAGVTHCDRNLFAGDTSGLYRFWNSQARS